MAGSIKVTGLRELSRALKQGEGDLDKGMRRELKEAAELVAADVRPRVHWDASSAAGVRPRVRAGGAVVAQTRRRTTGLRGDYGALQMRKAFIPGLEAKAPEVERKLEGMLDRLVHGF